MRDPNVLVCPHRGTTVLVSPVLCSPVLCPVTPCSCFETQFPGSEEYRNTGRIPNRVSLRVHCSEVGRGRRERITGFHTLVEWVSPRERVRLENDRSPVL